MPRNNLNEKQRQRLVQHLLAGSKEGKLGKTDVAGAAKKFECSIYQVRSVWNRYKQQDADGSDINLRNKRFGNSGRKSIDFDKAKEALLEVPLKNRTTQRAVAAQLGMSQQVLQRNLKKLGMRATPRF